MHILYLSLKLREKTIWMLRNFTHICYRHHPLQRFPPEYESELQLNATVSAAAFSPRRKGKHSYRGGVFYIPDVQANSSQPASTPSTAPSTPNPTTPPTNALATGTSGTPSGSAAQSSSGTINTNRGFLFRCFGPSPTN